MPILLIFSFIAGIVTILSPCILPILPIVLSGSVGGGHKRPIGIVLGFIGSFTFFTLALASIVQSTNLSADALRNIAVFVIFFLGLSMVIPQTQHVLELLFSKFSALVPSVRQENKTGFWSGILVGLSLGLVWTPCVGPILASVITLAATSEVNAAAALITLAYSFGTAIPLFAIVVGGRSLLQKAPFLLSKGAVIQRVFGILMIGTAVLLYTGLDRKFQAWVLETFPNYGVGLTSIEDQSFVREELDKLKDAKTPTLQQVLRPDYGLAPELVGGTHWINSDPLLLANLRGKVVLIDFWTYTCINCIRTLPYVTGWYEKYKDQGFVVIGVHSPEFAFEKETKNVEAAMRDFGITYPVVQDNNFAIWKAYDNHYWPAHYFIDAQGHIRKTHFGEGKYEESEKFIQELLKEANEQSAIPTDTLNLAEEKNSARTPESYLGYQRIARFVSPEGIAEDSLSTYSVPSALPLHGLAYGGQWMIGEEHAETQENSTLELQFEAQEVFLVMRKVEGAEQDVPVKVYLDNVLVPANSSGEDVKNGIVNIKEDRLYKLIKLPTPGRHRLKLEFPEGNVEVFAFTFG